MFRFTKDETIEIILYIILIVIIIIAFVMLKALMVGDYPIINNRNLATLNLKTGDILSVSYNHRFGAFISAWSGSAVSHPALVYKRSTDNKIFLIEAAIYDKPWRGVMKIPLLKWLEYNEDHEIFYTKYNGPEITDTQILQSFDKIKDKHLEAFNLSWYRLLKKDPYQKIEKINYVCYELIVQTLQELNIVRKKYLPVAYWPSDICYARLDYNDGYSYSTPVTLMHRYKGLKSTDPADEINDNYKKRSNKK